MSAHAKTALFHRAKPKQKKPKQRFRNRVLEGVWEPKRNRHQRQSQARSVSNATGPQSKVLVSRKTGSVASKNAANDRCRAPHGGYC
jgi:hypothetical protein